MVVLDATIVTVALPSIQRSLHFSPANLQWVLSAYTLTFGGLLLFGGRVGDVLGRRRMFVIGLLLFSGASFAGGLATTSTWLVAARAVQGCAAAIAAPTALSLIGDSFEEGPARTRAMGVYAAMSGAGSAIGLLLGGALTDIASWRWVFFVNVPIGVTVAAIAPRALPKSAPCGGHLDVPGAVAVTAATTALVYGLVRAPTDGLADTITVACLAPAALLFAVFILVEIRTKNPLVPLRVLASRNRAATYVVMLCTAAAIFAVFFFLTQVLQNAFGCSPIGGASLPALLTRHRGDIGDRRQVPREGRTRLFSSLGSHFSVAAIGLVWLSRLDLQSTYWRDILGPMLSVSARTLALDSALHGYRSAFLVGAAIATVGGLVALAAIRVAARPDAARLDAEEGAVNGDRARVSPS